MAGNCSGCNYFSIRYVAFLNTPVGTMPPFFAFPEAENVGGILVDAIQRQGQQAATKPETHELRTSAGSRK